MVTAELGRVESETGARVRPDAALVDEVTFLVEYPVAVCGEFDRSFLEVPEEVVVSAMRAHQRYFAMEDAGGALQNRFVTIAGTVTRDLAVVRHGNERVLAARLADARFFFREDERHGLEYFAGKLDGVVFQKKLGTVGAKVERVRRIAQTIAGKVGADAGLADRAAALCKADLTTSMVGEFPDLQGVMGRHYATAAGEPAEVAAAIEEHYMPRGAGARLPGSDLGAALGLADRIDTLVGCFAVGLSPSGSADPYGLRRAALGILSILLDRGWSLGLGWLTDTATEALGPAVKVPAAVRQQVLEFFRTRLRGLLIEAGGAEGDEAALAADCVDAALASGADDVPDARARSRALSRLRTRADFEPLAVAFKRVANILKGEAATAAPDPSAFVEGEEKTLWGSFTEIESRVEGHLEGGDYSQALAVLAELKAPVDRFFDKVLVMDEDPRVRQNRLALLGRINATFTRIADFRQLAV